MKHSISHDLGLDKAKEVATKALDSYKSRFAEYNPQTKWVSDTRCDIGFSVKGMSLNGVLEVTPASIDMDLDVPFMLRPFKGTALSVIEREITKWLEKAKAGSL